MRRTLSSNSTATTGKAAFSKSVKTASPAADQAGMEVAADLVEASVETMAAVAMVEVAMVVEATAVEGMEAVVDMAEVLVVAVDMEVEVVAMEAAEVVVVTAKPPLLLPLSRQTHSPTMLHLAQSRARSSTCAT